jgi:hypothetical protein
MMVFFSFNKYSPAIGIMRCKNKFGSISLRNKRRVDGDGIAIIPHRYYFINDYSIDGGRGGRSRRLTLLSGNSFVDISDNIIIIIVIILSVNDCVLVSLEISPIVYFYFLLTLTRTLCTTTTTTVASGWCLCTIIYNNYK